jgi:hypothetical protein
MKLEDKLDLILDHNNQYELGNAYFKDGVRYIIIKREVLRGPTRSYYTIYKPNPKYYSLSIWWATLRVKLGI